MRTKRNREQMIAFLNEEITRIEAIKLKCDMRIKDTREHIAFLEEKIEISKAKREAIEKKKTDRKSLAKAIQAKREEYKQLLKQAIKELMRIKETKEGKNGER